MKEIRITTAVAADATAAVRDALLSLAGERDVRLVFEPGEYYFSSADATRRFFGVSNNDSGEKAVVFPILGFDRLTIDGGGSTFIFGAGCFPIAVSESRHVTLKHMILDCDRSPIISFFLRNITDEGFDLCFDKRQNPFRIERGGLIFERAHGDVSNLEREFYLHRRIEHGHCVQFLITGDADVAVDHFPVPYSWMDAVEIEDGVRLTHRAEHPHVCRYREGEEVLFVADCEREVDMILLDRSENVRIKDVTIRRGRGMGVIGQLCENIELDGLRTDTAYHGEASGVTLDALHFVHCSGLLEIRNCEISYPMDDALNVHGIYTELCASDGEHLRVRLVHHQQQFINPYRAGDLLELIDPRTRAIVAKYRVAAAVLSDAGDEIELSGRFTEGADAAHAGCLVENPDRMPRLHLHDNHFYAYPNIRVSGRGGILIENNRFEQYSGTQLVDLSDFWFESGRIGEAIVRNNRFVDCVGRRGTAITVGISGVDEKNAPKIHRRVEISNNLFDGFAVHAVTVSGVMESVIENNRYQSDSKTPLRIDGIVR